MQSFMFARQVESDRNHHLKRIEWLTSYNPKWSDGTLVSSIDISHMLRQSHDCLSDISGMTGLFSSEVVNEQ